MLNNEIKNIEERFDRRKNLSEKYSLLLSNVYLSEQEKERIYLAREELKNGQTISHNDVLKEINQKLEFAFDWEGGLKGLKETSVEIQHKINKLR